MKQFKKRIGNLEVRSCNQHLLSIGEHTTAEIVKWIDGSCYTVAHWQVSHGLHELVFGYKRPFDCDRNTFWKLARYGQKKLEKMMV